MAAVVEKTKRPTKGSKEGTQPGEDEVDSVKLLTFSCLLSRNSNRDTESVKEA